MTILLRARRAGAALGVTVGLSAVAWVVTVRQMQGMDMGVATPLGSFAFFVALWAAMMAAMMLPGAAPAVLSRAHANGPVRPWCRLSRRTSPSGHSLVSWCTRCTAHTALPSPARW